jgi:hypothetical protein
MRGLWYTGLTPGPSPEERGEPFGEQLDFYSKEKGNRY